ncbi:uncharacterized protein [Coffea arabica]|uniref:HMA domain-containing protein n=1 Tax=Coffea arabica TaxID=13443 RepID=A0A6P6T2G9_COFAR|nr:protein SODIUM POTASSIUM ROOT DEFECTIVE 2-like isoform X1 [Coffea arabica]
MKGIDIFCASQAATSISCLSMDDPSSSSTIHLGGSGRAIDRYNPIIRDPRRFGGGSSSSRALPHVPSCSSQTPINPKPSSHSHQQTPYPHHHHHQNNNGTMSAMSSSSKPRNEKSHGKSTNTKKKFKMNNSNRSSSAELRPPSPNDEEKKKSSGSIKPASVHEPSDFRSSTSSFGNRKSWSCSSTKAAAGDFISPPGSSRYLLSDQAAFFNLITEDFDPLIKLLPPVVEAEPPPVNHSKPSNSDDNNSKALQKDDQSKSRSTDQVVVLRVSLHCRGCERKMRKHISRMEGVSSFNIDFAAKKVTVVGNVTPLEVLNSVSKVKNAQLWTPAAAAAAATAVPSFSHTNSSEINRNSQTTLLS